jgi:hypothetical protein
MFTVEFTKRIRDGQRTLQLGAFFRLSRPFETGILSGVVFPRELEYNQYTTVCSWRIAKSARNPADLTIHSEPLRSADNMNRE